LAELPSHLGYLLREAGLSYRDIAAVGVTAGPGSFTGVRLGMTLAKTIATAAECQIAALDTLEVIACEHLQNYRHCPGRVAVALDARRKELYCGVFSVGGETVHSLPREGPLLETAVRTPEQFAASLADSKDLRCLVGQGFSAYPSLVPPGFLGPVLASREASTASMPVLCELTLRALKQERTTAVEVTEPVYFRDADVQVSQGGTL